MAQHNCEAIPELPSIEGDFIRKFDDLVHDSNIVEIDVSANNSALVHYVHSLIFESRFVARGGILVRLVVERDETGANKYRYEHIYHASLLCRPIEAEEQKQVKQMLQEMNVSDAPAIEQKEEVQEQEDKGDEK